MAGSATDRLLKGWVQHPDIDYKYDYDAIMKAVASGEYDAKETFRELAKKDLFFLLVFGLQRWDANNAFVVQRCKEIEEGPKTNTLDLWAREHYKSTILTYALVIQEVCRNPEERIGIFSHTRPAAKKALRQIKHTLEGKVPVKKWFDDIFYKDPKKESPKWSEDEGLIVKRQSSAKEATIEAWGVVDGMPIGAHFTIRVYDDLVTDKSVTNPEQLRKTKEKYDLSHSLGTDGGRFRVIGTHYHYADLYMDLRKKLPPENIRIFPVAKEYGKHPVLVSKDYLRFLHENRSTFILNCQYYLEPNDPESKELDERKIRTYRKLPSPVNKYMIVDPANEKKKENDYTAMVVIGVDSDQNRFLIDGRHEKMDLAERWAAIKELFRANKPIQRIGYERYGLQADIQHFQIMQRVEGVYLPRFVELGGRTSKKDRIRRLSPILERGQFFVPEGGIIVHGHDIVKVVMDEISFFPHGSYDDIVDAIARIEDEKLEVSAPIDHYWGGEDSKVAELNDLIDSTYDMV